MTRRPQQTRRNAKEWQRGSVDFQSQEDSYTHSGEVMGFQVLTQLLYFALQARYELASNFLARLISSSLGPCCFCSGERPLLCYLKPKEVSSWNLMRCKTLCLEQWSLNVPSSLLRAAFLDMAMVQHHLSEQFVAD